MSTHRRIVLVMDVVASVTLALSALGQVYRPTPYFPPDNAAYYSVPDSSLTFGLNIDGIRSIIFNDAIYTPGSVTNSGPEGASYFEEFSSTLKADVTVYFSAGGSVSGVLNASGAAFMVVTNYARGDLGTFGTSVSILNNNWNGVLSYDNTTKPVFLGWYGAPGGTTVTAAQPPPLYEVSSHSTLDTVNLSLDDLNWFVSSGSMQLNMQEVAEPGTSPLLLAMAIGIWGARRFRFVHH